MQVLIERRINKINNALLLVHFIELVGVFLESFVFVPQRSAVINWLLSIANASYIALFL
jgi:hypothetical protein